MAQGTRQPQAAFAEPSGSMLSQQAERIELLETWLGMAMRQANDLFWEYDLGTHEMRTFSFDDVAQSKQRTFSDFPDSFLESGAVHPNSINSVRSWFENMRNGTVEGSANFLIKNSSTDDFSWSTFAYRMQFDSAGHPVRARGIRRMLASDPSVPGEAPRHLPVPDTVFPHLIRHLQTNALTGALSYMLVQGIERTGENTSISYDETMRKGANQLFRKESEADYLDQCSRDRALERLSEGRRWVVRRYRMVDSNGLIKPIQLSVNAVRDHETGEVTMLTFMSSIEQKSSWEATALKIAHRDPDTQLYERHDSDMIVEAIAKNSPETSLWAVTMIKLVGIDELAERNGETARNLKRDLAAAVNVFLDTDTVVCQYDDNTVGAFLPDASSGADVRRRIQTALSAARASLSDAPGLDEVHLIAGTVCGRMADLDLQVAAACALEVCDTHSDSTTDITLLARSVGREAAADGAIASRFNAPSNHGALREVDQQMFARCLQDMLLADSPGAAINSALAELGAHYEADRAYLLAITEDGRTLSVLFEWAPQGRPTIKQPFSGRSIERFPLIKRYMNTEEPVVVSKSNTLSFDGTDDSAAPWSFAIIPVSHAPENTMLLCLENPHASFTDWSLAEHLAPNIHNMWRRLTHGSSHAAHQIAGGAPMLGIQEFEYALGRAGSERHSSLGVLAIDVPNTVELVAEKGFAHAIDTAILIRHELVEAFGGNAVFCTGESELVALCIDTVYDTFIQRAAQVRRALSRSCPREFRIGSAWGDFGFNAPRLVRDARMVMLRDESELSISELHGLPERRESVWSKGLRVNGSPERSSLAESLDVYLQPKIDMRTGALVGAEALVRAFDENGTAITPTATITQMEEDGSIRNLDYFVFDRTLSIMSAWQEKGLRAIPVSSNFSRSTLLGSSALASVLAIMSRYPNVPADMVEMEVTETACDLERSTLTSIVGQFRDNGLRIALDDFGARYSNASVLANVCFDTVKIDRSLVTDISTNPVSRLLVRNIVEICNKRNMECVAEGIETKAQARALIEEGCCICQGFYYDKPMPASVFERKYLFGATAA